MNLEMVAAIIVSFLGGSALTTIGFMVAFTSRMAKVETNVNNLTTICSEIKSVIHPSPCAASLQVHEKVSLHEQRLDRMESIVMNGNMTK